MATTDKRVSAQQPETSARDDNKENVLPPATAATSHEQKPKPKSALRDLGPILRPHHVALLLAVSLSIIATVLGVAQPLVVKQMIDSVSASNGPGNWVLILVGVTLAEAIFRGLQSFALQRTGEAVILGVRQSLIGRILGMSVTEAERRSKGDLLSRMGADSNLLRTVVTGGVFELLSAVLMFVGAVVLMVALDPLLFGITFAAVVLGGFGVTLVGQRMRATSTRTQEQVAAMTTAVDRALSSLRLVKATGAEREEEQKVGQAATRAYANGVSMARLQASVQPLMSISIQGAFVVVLAIGGIRVASGVMTVGDLMAFILYLFLLVMPVTQAMSAYTQIQGGLAAFDRISEVLNVGPESSGDDTDFGPQAGVPHIRFQNVGFSYAESSPVLENVSFTIARGSRVAVVGPTGAGKSTIISLIEKFYEPTSGRIDVDGQSIIESNTRMHRRKIGFVEQNAPAYAGTLRENLLLGNTEGTPSDEALLASLEQVGLGHLVTRDELGLDSKVGEGGNALSGGELQRLAWARVLGREHSLLLFDEPTSSVDARTESVLTELLDRRPPEVTLVVVAHRLSTVISSDAIIVLDQGGVSDIGTHSELLKSSPLYAELARHQLLD